MSWHRRLGDEGHLKVGFGGHTSAAQLALILDTGPLYASLDRADQFHLTCRRLLEGATEALIIPSPVLVEVDYWISTRLRPSTRTALLNNISSGALKVEDLAPDDYVRIRDLCLQYEDADIGFVDASVLAITERLNEPKLATLDKRHFGLLRPRHVSALQLLPD